MTLLQRLVTFVYSSKTSFLLFGLILGIIFSSGNIIAEEYYEGFIDTSLPQPLKDSDVKLYQQIFALQEIGEIEKADMLVGQLSNRILVGHIQSQKYLHPNAWRSSYDELRTWLSNYSDHPHASRISWLAKKRKPKSASNPDRKAKSAFLSWKTTRR